MKLYSKWMAASITLAMFAAVQPASAETLAKPAPEKQSCFFTNQISGWNRVDDKTIRVVVSPKKQYDLTLMSPVTDSRFRDVIGVKSSPSSVICTGNGLGVTVVTGSDIGPSSYPVTKVALAPVVKKNTDAKPAPAPETAN